ncbi:2TM domain-containing protein [Flavobacterium aciduliphilum]|uniref:Histidine kinase n=1 Tax=Flavobacterium aciduliphilum TaxID=1101402 RepID=A0A328YC49_9FLAO|nr:2TM domain-containing protein [Flavobacterium aciduliphilum]RAR70105.1 histidine kinase [Flavobacterium aciduliphilum]
MSNFLKDIPKNIILSIAIFIVVLILNMLFGVKICFNRDLFLAFGYTTLYTFSLSSVNVWIFDYLDKIFEEDRFSKKRLIVGFFSSFSASLGTIFLLRIFQEVLVNGATLQEFLKSERPNYYVISILITFFVTLFFYAFHFYKAYQENKVKEQKIIAGTANAKFESLKNQIDPHFLFNSLNVLNALIEENPENAQRFTTSLSKIYRYVLEQKDKELVSVAEELAFAKTYMILLAMRFENSITFELPDSYTNPEAMVVPLSLQLLLENCIKHNIVSQQKPLHIRIFIKDDALVVQNDLQKKEGIQDRKGVGLQNIVDRYALLTNRNVYVDDTAQTFSVFLPILTKQISVAEYSSKYSENQAYYRAKKRVEELKGFYGNVISYCIVIPILIGINFKFSPQFQWFWFSAFGWGFGVVMHALKVFGYSSDWEERKIRAFLEKNNENKKWS